MPNRQVANGAFCLVDTISNDDIDEIDVPPSASDGPWHVSLCMTTTYTSESDQDGGDNIVR
jgi:hypothetical protein